MNPPIPEHGKLPVMPPSVKDPSAAVELNSFAPLASASKAKKKGPKKAVVIAVVAVVLVAVIGFAINGLLDAAAPKAMETVDVIEGPFEDLVQGKASLQPVRTMVASSEVDGIVAELKVSEGQQVKEGDVLYTVKNDDLDTAVAQAKSELQSAKDGVTQAQNRLNTAKATPSVTQSMDAQGNTVLIDNTAVQISDAQSQLNTANSTLTSAQRSYDAAVEKADKRTVRATVSGTVIECNITEGSSLASLSTQGKAPLRVADMTSLQVKVPVSEIDIVKVKEGQKGEVTFDSYPDLASEATVTHISQTSSADTASPAAGAAGAGSASSTVRYEVTLQIDSPDERLKSGMTAHVNIATLSLEKTLIVPAIALTDVDGETAVAKIPSGSDSAAAKGTDAEYVKVKVIAQNTSRAAVEVVEGSLSAGDKLGIVSGKKAATEGDATPGVMVGA